MTITTFFLLSLVGCFVIPSAVSSPEGGQVIITEVLYDTPGTDADEEWIELFNPTKDDVNLTNWSIDDNYDTFTFLSGSIPAAGYFVVARNSTQFNTLYGKTPDLATLNLALGNSGDKLTLYNNEDTAVDFVAWEEEEPGWTVNATHTTIRRISEVDTDTVSDWEDSGTLGDPGTGIYVPEKTPISVFAILMGLVAIVGISYRRKMKKS